MNRLFVLAVLVFTLAACHEGDMVFHLISPDIVAQEAELEAVAQEEADQQDCSIKVNRSRDGSFIYHLPDGVYWSRVKIDLTLGEFYACTEQEALDAGARKALR